MGWWNNRRERRILQERLTDAETSIKQLRRYQQINSQLLALYLNELRLAHAALRRKGKALKMLHKQRMAEKRGV